ncbi:MAG: Transaldolase [Microgenomates group bacterium GW2011_GWA1_48_10]|nr:MAG: Transaldolase [Microgenomates group bacterium GW2011_GWA1_48_10]
MRPSALTTRIFLDGGDPRETEEIKKLLGFLDGQTTNPTLIARHPYAKERLASGKKFNPKEIFDFYENTVREISSLLPDSSVSIEVYADERTEPSEMFSQAEKMWGWIPNAHIKFPITTGGIVAAQRAVHEGMRVNMTLCFSEEQAAAVYAATRGAARGRVFLSPFVGRLDDRGKDGISLVKNIVELYRKGNGHVEILAASVRNLAHFLGALRLGADIITTPASVLKEWAERGMPILSGPYDSHGLTPLPYQDLDLGREWEEFDIDHALTKEGIERFSQDWNALIA